MLVSLIPVIGVYCSMSLLGLSAVMSWDATVLFGRRSRYSKKKMVVSVESDDIYEPQTLNLSLVFHCLFVVWQYLYSV